MSKLEDSEAMSLMSLRMGRKEEERGGKRSEERGEGKIVRLFLQI